MDILCNFRNNADFVRLAPLFKGVAIVELCSWQNDMTPYIAINNFFPNKDLIGQILLLGGNEKRDEDLNKIFPKAKIEIGSKDEDLTKYDITSPLVIYIGDKNFFMDPKIQRATRVAYYVIIDGEQVTYQLNLKNFIFATNEENPSEYCSDKMESLDIYYDNLGEKDCFSQAMHELETGCKECSLTGGKGYEKRCPLARRMIARCYREGRFVPQSDKIAHFWEVKAAKQGYIPALLQVAKEYSLDYNKGLEALRIYRNYAWYNRDAYIEFLDSIDYGFIECERICLVPFIAKGAFEGDENMLLRLSEVYDDPDYSLPNDVVQKLELVKSGAEAGNVKFMERLAKIYYNNSDWKSAYYWYGKLLEIERKEEWVKLYDEATIKMISGSGSLEAIVAKGRDFLFGYSGEKRDVDMAYKFLHYAYQKGAVAALGLLGFMYENGCGVEKNNNMTQYYYRNGADKRDLFCMKKMQKTGVDFVDTIEREIRNSSPIAYRYKAIYLADSENSKLHFMMQAARLGDPVAQYEVAKIYQRRGDDELANEWLEKSARNGCYLAKGDVGCMRYRDRERDELTFTYLRDSYEQGYVAARKFLADSYFFGRGTKTDREKGYELYHLLAADGDADAQVKLCEGYYYGYLPLQKSYEQALKWGELALANGGNVRFKVAYSAAECGKRQRAIELYTILANEGDSVSMNNLGCQLTDIKDKCYWFEKAVEKGDDYGHWNLGRFYRDGRGVEKNIKKAYELLLVAAKTIPEAKLTLINLCRDNEELNVPLKQLIDWYKEIYSANKDCNMLFQCADMILSKSGGAYHNEVYTCYDMAAKRGEQKAFLDLGRCYQCGIGVDKDIELATFWYRKAALNGNKDAQERLRALGVNWLEKNGDEINLFN